MAHLLYTPLLIASITASSILSGILYPRSYPDGSLLGFPALPTRNRSAQETFVKRLTDWFERLSLQPFLRFCCSHPQPCRRFRTRDTLDVADHFFTRLPPLPDPRVLVRSLFLRKCLPHLQA